MKNQFFSTKCTNISFNGIVCKANTGRNTLLHLALWRAVDNRFKENIERNIHDIINMRSMNIVPTLKPFQS